MLHIAQFVRAVLLCIGLEVMGGNVLSFSRIEGYLVVEQRSQYVIYFVQYVVRMFQMNVYTYI